MDQRNMYVYGRYEQQGSPIESSRIECDLTFFYKPEYLKWVQEWKRMYNDHSDYIRDLKATTKSFQQDNDDRAPYSQSKLAHASLEARGMLVLRRFAKARSWELKQQIEDAVATGAYL